MSGFRNPTPIIQLTLKCDKYRQHGAVGRQEWIAQESFPKAVMPFAVYMVGFLAVMAAVVFAAVVVGVPQQYLAIAVGVLLALAIILLVSRMHARTPSERRR
jgi:O-antigen ligase